MNTATPLLDTTSTVETPEGIELTLNVAGPVVRGLAWLLDLLFRCIIYLILGLISIPLDKMGGGLMLIILFLMEWFYPVYFDYRHNGVTPGKKRFKIRVVHDDGTPVSASRSILRNLLRAVDFLPFGYGLGLLSCLCNQQFKRLGDFAAGTVVIYDKNIDPTQAIQPGKAQAANLNLSAAEQRCIVAFAERLPALSPARGAELADILTPVTQQDGLDNIERLNQIARWSAGIDSQLPTKPS